MKATLFSNCDPSPKNNRWHSTIFLTLVAVGLLFTACAGGGGGGSTGATTGGSTGADASTSASTTPTTPAAPTSAPVLTCADCDGDGLIDVNSIERLNNIRHNLAGSSYKTSSADAGITTGCPTTGCKGYELTSNLDFKTAISYNSGTVDANYISNNADPVQATNAGWAPIGASSTQFNSIFHGRSFKISNLFINRNGSNDIGLFGVTGLSAVVSNIELRNIFVKGLNQIGGLIGSSNGNTLNVFVSGKVAGYNNVGGLIGESRGYVFNSVAVATLSGHDNVGGAIGISHQSVYSTVSRGGITGSHENIGGLIGNASGTSVYNNLNMANVLGSGIVGGIAGSTNTSTTHNSLSIGTLRGNYKVGGIVGFNNGIQSLIAASFWDNIIASVNAVAGGTGKTTTELKIASSNIIAGHFFEPWRTGSISGVKWDSANSRYDVCTYGAAGCTVYAWKFIAGQYPRPNLENYPQTPGSADFWTTARVAEAFSVTP